MKTMTVRDLGEHWPEAEKAPAEDGEIIVTHDAVPVAKIVPYAPAEAVERTRFDFDAHRRWIKSISQGEPKHPTTDELLQRDRNEAALGGLA